MKSMQMVLALLLSVLVVFSGAGWAADMKEYTLLLGEQKNFDVSNIANVAVGDGEVAAARLVGNRLLLTGKGVGMTTLTMIAQDGTSTAYAIKVLAQDPVKVKEEITSLLKGIEGTEVKQVGDRVFIDGYVYRDEDRIRVERVAAAYDGVVNLSTFSKEYLPVKRLVQLAYNRYEIQKSGALNMGVNWKDLLGGTVVNTTYETVFQGGAPSTSVQPVVDSTTGETVGYSNRFPDTARGGNVMITSDFNPLKLNQDDGRIRLMDSHQAIVSEKTTSKYVVGGEFPVVIVLNNTAYIEYKEYGAIFQVTPEVDKQENLMLDMNLTLSDLDFTVQSFGAPGLVKVTQNTDVTVKAGETVVLGGYLRSKRDKSEDGLPGLSQVPVLGYFFGSKNFQDSDREGVVFITPTLTNPSDDFRNDPKIRGVLESYEKKDFKL